MNGDWDDHSAKKGNIEASNVIVVEHKTMKESKSYERHWTGLLKRNGARLSLGTTVFFFKSSTYLNRTAPWNEALGGPPVWFLNRFARIHVPGVKISENAESFLCKTKAVRGVVVETFD